MEYRHATWGYDHVVVWSTHTSRIYRLLCSCCGQEMEDVGQEVVVQDDAFWILHLCPECFTATKEGVLYSGYAKVMSL